MADLARYYFFIYWFIVMLMTVNKYIIMRRWNAYSVIQKTEDYRPLIVFSVFYIILFGFRPIMNDGTFGDTGVYATKYELLQSYSIFDNIEVNLTSDWFFNTLMRLCSLVMDVHFFFAIVMMAYIVMMIAGCIKLDNRHGALMMLFCFGAFSFYTYSVNGIRNGMACSIIIFALSLLSKDNRLWPIILSFIAIGCHKSTALPVVCMFLAYYLRGTKLMFFIWLGAIIISIVIGDYINNILLMVNYDARLANNLQSDYIDGEIVEHRFRWDFLLYSSIPIVLGWYTIFIRKLQDWTYILLLGTYIYANSFWVLAIRAAYSNRIAYLSWFIYPIVLAYPLLNFPVFKKKHSKKVAWILLVHFVLTTVLLRNYFLI